MVDLKANVLYFGDNLDILRRHIPDESVDLIYLDPPFNSKADYNVLFKEPTGKGSSAQIQAFTDTWHWDDKARDTYAEIQATTTEHVRETIRALFNMLSPTGGGNDMMAYLVMMTARLVELHRVLKATGSLYLHCDPTASHYLKVMLDTVFGANQFRNEIIWRRTGSHNQARRYGPIHDVLFFYSKTDNYYFVPHHRPFLKGHVESYFTKKDARGQYWTNALTGAGTRKGESGLPWREYDPTKRGRHWAVPGDICSELEIPAEWSTQQKLEELYQQGFVDLPPSGSNALPTCRQYLDDARGIPYQDIWAYQPHTSGVLYNSKECVDEDVRWLLRQAQQGQSERRGYQTQKPVGILERIIRCSSPSDGVVLDPFCGCGTAIVAAQKLGRRWIGIDVTNLAIAVMRKRLAESFPGLAYEVIGLPTTVSEAVALAQQEPDGRYQFQWWVLGLLEATPVGDGQKKGSDKGKDGLIAVHHDGKGTVTQVVVQVKSGHVGAHLIRDLKGVCGDDKMGLFITLEPPTEPMMMEASTAELYYCPLMEKHYPRIQILTVEQLLQGKRPQLPPRVVGERGRLVGLALKQLPMMENT